MIQTIKNNYVCERYLEKCERMQFSGKIVWDDLATFLDFF